ncbi:SUMF1/EgtB/PvdO family nonheme iron enzyme [Sorangium sp. So ce726]|uniref:nSTAND1 domain-containing NTPase n=1 Tax=Sorangium sp. So ce726 TaxID=3133319 RepID=UPI003F60C41E
MKEKIASTLSQAILRPGGAETQARAGDVLPPSSFGPESLAPSSFGPESPGPSSFHPPSRFEEYRLLHKLGSGGMGDVYLAHDTLLDRMVAVKFIRAATADAEVRARLLAEARAAARIQHPNVVAVFRVGELRGRLFVVSEFVRGQSLDRVDIPMPSRRVLELGAGLARGLAAAHRRGVLHLDIKPANAVLTAEGEAKLLDFGLAKLLEPAARPDPRGARSDVPGGRSDMPGGRSDVPGGRFDVPGGRSDMPGGRSDVPGGRSDMPGGRSDMPGGRSDMPGGRSDSLGADALSDGEALRSSQGDADAAIAPGDEPLEGEFREAAEMAARLLDATTSVGGGTPHYLPPELWRDELATRRSDVYSLGALLFELCAGVPPHHDVPMTELPLVVQSEAPRPLASLAPGVDPRLAGVIERCLEIDPADRFASGDELRDALEQLLARSRHASVAPEGNPYRGLLVFDLEHRAVFYGRSSETGTILDRLRSEPMIVVAGDSGSGKSSLCRAGVLSLVLEGALGGGRAFQAAMMVPGRQPLAALAAALEPVLGAPAERIAEAVRAAPGSLARDLRARLGERGGLVLFIDQMEELATLSSPGEAALVGEVLSAFAARSPSLRLLATVRGDFLARVAGISGLGDDIERALYLLRPMSADKLREAITGPARAKGVAFESDAVVDALVESTARAEGGLPLLQFALAELWDARAAPDAPLSSADLAQIGGVEGALARHADRVLGRMPPEVHAAARRLLGALITPQGTRARRAEGELAEKGGDGAARAALDALVQGRLLFAREGEQGTVYEIAHEALIHGWGTLRHWLEEQREQRATRQRLDASAAEWERLGRRRDALFSARQLKEARGLDPADLPPREAAFLRASRRAVLTQRAVRWALVVGVPLIAALLYGALELRAARQLAARADRKIHEAALTSAAAALEGAQAEALRVEALSAFDRRRRDEGEALWELTRRRAAEAERLQLQVSQKLEAALTLDGARNDARARLGDVLYERALAAEARGHASLRDELLQRMTTYDPDGVRRQRWNAPVEVAIETDPPGADITLERYESDAEGRRQLVGQHLLGTTPFASIALAQGSYLLTCEARNRTIVRYPFLVQRGESLKLSIPLPHAGDVPPGYIYIPPGRFLFGAALDDMYRWAFLSTVPLHEIRTGAYLIARHETTFQEWLDYIQELPKESRGSSSIQAGNGAMTGALGLRRLPNGVWQLTIQPTVQAYTARAGEPLVYPSRAVRAQQDWLRFPVTGISFAQATEYAAWLHRTGRVRGARLCTDYEWERAARGADSRIFPHGDRLSPSDANFDETYGKESSTMGPDEVGSHPASRSPFGVDDMAGNVLEWAISSIETDKVLLRGGAYIYDQTSVRSDNRTVVDGTFLDPVIGLRICASFPPPP